MASSPGNMVFKVGFSPVHSLHGLPRKPVGWIWTSTLLAGCQLAATSSCDHFPSCEKL